MKGKKHETHVRPVLAGMLVALVGVLALAGMATAEEKPPPPSTAKSVVLKKYSYTEGVKVPTLTTAELVFESCAVATEGELTVNKQDVDEAKLEEVASTESPKPSCETTLGTERIREVIVRTYPSKAAEEKEEGGGPGENGSMVFKGQMKYRTSSPKCTYATEKFEAEFKIKGLVETSSEKPMKSVGVLVSGESEEGCASTMNVYARGVLYWEKSHETHGTFYAERKNEK